MSSAPESTQTPPDGAKERHGTSLRLLTLTALGVVYGDIGTSPLYAVNLCFRGQNAIAPTEANVLGVLSLIVWALLLVISVKYLLFVLRADNDGEGGILALVALLNPWRARGSKRKYVLMLMGLFGAALLYGDGTITPAISVLSAIEGLKIATPVFEPYVVPVTIAILVALFYVQHRGTTRVGVVFGPIVVVWFAAIAGLGVDAIWQTPRVLAAVDPRHAAAFFAANGFAGLAIFGIVFLVVTGGEALYADMGHFGRRPIRIAWFGLVLPALVLNYIGQGALVLSTPSAPANLFFGLAPSWALYPMVLLATMATVIASQAVISGAYSLTRQAVQLGLLPRMNIVQSSAEEIGQIYIPMVNWLLMLATIGLVIGFGSSDALASAYGVAITTTMVITTVLAYCVARSWGWPPPVLAGLIGVFLAVDLAFFGANLLKIVDGGWYPLAVGVAVFMLMTTWHTGRELLARRLRSLRRPLDEIFEELSRERPARVAGTAVFMTSDLEGSPPILRHQLIHNHVLHEQVVLCTVIVEDVPRVRPADRVSLEKLRLGFYRLVIRCGFMENPNVPAALKRCAEQGLDIDLAATTYFLGRETVLPTPKVGMAPWREHLFAVLSRNAGLATAYYRIPPVGVVEIGVQVEI